MTTTPVLRTGHSEASTQDEDKPNPALPVSETLEAYYKKHETLRGIPGHIIRKAWFTMAHLMVPPGAVVLDMACTPGMTYAMAALNPQARFIGIDSDKKLIKSAQKNYEAENLEFRNGDIQSLEEFDKESIDAIVNSYTLHEIFSGRKFSERAVVQSLEHHFSLLKPEGLMFIRDYAMPPPGEYILLEMPDVESPSEAIEDLSEADLLVRYSEKARPRGDKSCTGFFLEELPPRFPQTRLFRLPYRWAYEFMMRKDDRENWERELATEYTFFTPREYRKNLRSLSARVLYTAPQWDDAIIRDRFEGHFRMYSDDGKPLSLPPTSFIAVAQKLGERKSLHLHERRPSSQASENQIRITAMRNEISGELFDVVTRDVDITEVMPYRITETGELNIFVHEGLPRGIANAVPRTGKQLDDKRWSGHMTEAIAVPSEAIYDVDNGEPKQVVLFARDYLGLKPALEAKLEKGPIFYPAPDLIDEQIKTRYLRVSECEGALVPRQVTEDLKGFTTQGRIREVSAQSVLNAISVGYIPNAQLEGQILALYELLEMQAETWDECPLALDECVPDNIMDVKKFMADLSATDGRFKNIRGTAGKIRTLRSLFVDEGWVDGGLEGLAARDIEFIISDEQTVNKAVILPLNRHAVTGVVMGGMIAEYLPIPQRHKGNGLTLRAPSINLPKEITSMDQAKRYIAAQFDIPVEKVARLGESYFCHIGMTPTRIFPFCVVSTGKKSTPIGGPIQYAPMMALINMVWRVEDYNLNRNILTRYMRVFQRQMSGNEVTGDWVRSASQLYQQTLAAAPAVMNATIADKPVAQAAAVNTQAAAPQAPAVPAGGIPGWSSQKSREKSEQEAAKAASTYISSPDFVDVTNPFMKDGAIAKSHSKSRTLAADKQDAKNDNKRKDDK